MKAKLRMRLARGARARHVAMALIPLALFMAGCSGTLQTQSTHPDDTYFRWQPRMETLPVEVHGAIQQFGSDDIAKQIPYGTTPHQYAIATEGHGKLATMPRIVLYVDSQQRPASEAYCDTVQVAQPVPATGAETYVTAALCDGPRLIDLTTRDIRNASIQDQGIASIVKSMKHRLLFGLTDSDQVNPAEYGNG